MADTPTYDVVLLVEQALSDLDARQVRSLHEGVEDPVVYHVLLPVDDAEAQVEAAVGGLGAGEYIGAPALMHEVDVQELEADARDRGQADLQASLEALQRAGATAVGQLVHEPVESLKAKVAQVDGREAIILTREHVVAEFFHLDWTAQARRAVGVPVLHLVEHETFDEQAGEGEGVTGL
jgi:multidrug efflux pump subunit AcrA (membrane-fusion protein)